MRIFTRFAYPAATEGLSAVCPECPHHLQLAFLFGTGYLMSELTEVEKVEVASNPLGNSLDAVRDELSRALNFAESQDLPDSMRNLLCTLSMLRLSEKLSSRIGLRSLSVDLFEIRARVREGDVLDKHLRPLSEAVINQLGDVAIWNAAIGLVRNVATAPWSMPRPPVIQKPFRHTSAVQQGFDENREIDDAELGEEKKSDTFSSVGGFFAKYFEGKSWNDLATEKWEEVQADHNGVKWKKIPNRPSEDAIQKWWLDFQLRFLKDRKGVRAIYDTDRIPESFDKPPPHQDELSEATCGHNWPDVAVVGEVKQSSRDKVGTYRQMYRYVRDVFAHQPTRLFVHAFTITGTQMATWICDRSGLYRGETFNIHKDPERFIRVISGYVMMNDKELGFNPYIKRRYGKNIIMATGVDGGQEELVLEAHPLVFQRAIVSRATCCFRAMAPRGPCVVKLSWVPDKQRPEAELIQEAQGKGVTGLARLCASCKVTDTHALRDGLSFPEPRRPRSKKRKAAPTRQIEQTMSSTHSHDPATTDKRIPIDPSGPPRCSKRRNFGGQKAEVGPMTNSEFQDANVSNSGTAADVPYENRVLRAVAVSAIGRPINQFHNVAELIQCLRDAVKAHRFLYQQGNILHRDISEGTIIITNPDASNCKGMLIDLDIAQEVGDSSSGTLDRTCTLQFMAIEALRGQFHTYRHDLESFFYVLIWVCIRRSWDLIHASKQEREDSLIRQWYFGSYKNMTHYKTAYRDAAAFEDILDEFHTNFEEIKPLCREIRGIIMVQSHHTDTPEDSNIMYDKMIDAFDRAVEMVQGEKKSKWVM